MAHSTQDKLFKALSNPGKSSSPQYARSNSFIEKYVWHIKSTIKNFLREINDVQLALLEIRVTLLDSRLPSPFKLLLRWPLTTTLSSQVEPGKEEHLEWLEERSANMKTHYDLSSQNKELPSLYPGQCVQILSRPNNTRHLGTIIQKVENPRSYIVETPNGARLCRNYIHTVPIPVAKIVHFADTEPDTTQTTSGPSENSIDDKTTNTNITRLILGKDNNQ